MFKSASGIYTNEQIKETIIEIGEWLKNTDFKIDLNNNISSVDINIHIKPGEIINADVIQNFGIKFKENEDEENKDEQ